MHQIIFSRLLLQGGRSSRRVFSVETPSAGGRKDLLLLGVGRNSYDRVGSNEPIFLEDPHLKGPETADEIFWGLLPHLMAHA